MCGHELLTASRRAGVLVFAALLVLLPHAPLRAAGPAARPEDAGVSSERLQRVGDLTSDQEFLRDFENMVMQAVVAGASVHGGTSN